MYSRRLIVRSQNQSGLCEIPLTKLCEIPLTKLSYMVQQVGIMHLYAVTKIEGLSCHL